MNNRLSRFDEFWQLYPKKRDKGHAEKAWRRLSQGTRNVILEILPTYYFPADPQFIPYPATWLNGKHWLDEQPTRRKDKRSSLYWNEKQWHQFWKSYEGVPKDELIAKLIEKGFSEQEAKEKVSG